MAYKKLKSFVAPMPGPDGQLIRTGRYVKSPTIDMMIETTGSMRMFIPVPEYMGDCVGKWKGRAGIAVEQIEAKRGSGHFYALLGRDPEELERAWRDLCNHFKEVMDDTKVVPVLLVRSTTRDHFGGRGYNKAAIQFEFERYLKNTKERPTGFHAVTIYDYEWNDELKPLKQRGGFNEASWTELPYDAVLWDRLVALREQVNAAQEKLEELIESGDFSKRLLAGNGLQLLSGPAE